MVIQHNLQAYNANRMYLLSTGTRNSAMERLSSGYRINRAADGAAGLTISEKMRWQIRGLNKACQNVQDGISLIQVADGALSESHSILQRMNELATQAANDTNTSTDRSALQAEITQLADELDRIATDTNYNMDIYPLSTGHGSDSPIKGITITVTNDSTQDVQYKGVTYALGSSFKVDNVISVEADRAGVKVTNYAMVDSDRLNFYFAYDFDYTYSIKRNPDKFQVHTMDELKVDKYGYVYYEAEIMEADHADITGPEKKFPINVYFAYDEDIYGEGAFIYEAHGDDGNPTTSPSAEYLRNMNTYNVGAPVRIQAGAKSGQYISLPLINASADNMGINKLDVMSHDSAGEAMTKIQKAVDRVSSWRSDFGAIQNRLEHTLNNLKNTSENTQDAESRIRDADMAEEMLKFSTADILAQAGQSVLSQIYNSAGAVMNLLQ